LLSAIGTKIGLEYPVIGRTIVGMILTVSLSCIDAQATDIASWVSTQQDDAKSEPVRAESTSFSTCASSEEIGYKAKLLKDVALNIRLDAPAMPEDCSADLFQAGSALRDRRWQLSEFNWAASDLFGQPAYFDDPILERYGQSHHALIQPALSGAHFFSQFPLMPYKIGIDRPHDQIYTLGYHRPGSPMPLLGRRLPWEADAAGFESMSWVALLFIFP